MRIDTPLENLSDARALVDELTELRARVVRDAEARLAVLGHTGTGQPGVLNLARYLAVRSTDLRDLQRRLMVRGLSSLGRLEGRVLPTLDAVLRAAEQQAGQTPTVEAPTPETYFAGEQALAASAVDLFGHPRPGRTGRIMVTLPGEAAADRMLIHELVKAGMDVARINCAHDDVEVWERLAENVRRSGRRLRRDVRVHMDISGPKIRTEEVAALVSKGRLETESRLRLVSAPPLQPTRDVPFVARIGVPDLARRLRRGDRFAYDDGRLLGEVVSVERGSVVVSILRAKSGGVRLKVDKGVNFPDSRLDLSPLTDRDRADLDAVVALSDIIGYSFVSDAADLDLLEHALARRARSGTPLGLVAKIERPDAVRNLPQLIARAAGVRPFGVMIARGDLAAEIGFERTAEMQEEILWLCEAAHVPVIWATQVLECLVRDGIPSRGEMTDAAMATRAECIMLNKGPEIVQAVGLLDRMYRRMDGHVHKKTPTMRPLGAFRALPPGRAGLAARARR
jgi:pyruvate kinase